MTEQKLDVSVFNWGPCVIKLKIADETKKLLLEEGAKNKEDYSTKLAGIIEKETGYSQESTNKFLPHMAQYLGVYDQMFQKFIGKPYEKKPEYNLTALWINYQKANDNLPS